MNTVRDIKPMAWLLAIGLLFSQWAWAVEEDTICAVVKIEIPQELTLERQGFEAIMKINNALEDQALTNLSVAVNFLDANGEEVVASSDPNHPNAKFFIRVANVEGISNVSGSGELAPASSATARWLIVPAPGTGGNLSSGALYYVGAKLTYTLNGQEDFIEVAPDTIFVKPMPKLTLDYFLPSDVHADDPLTTAIEPIEPFTLGVRVRNNGNGPANKVKIESAQPKIVENKQGLLIDFEITGSYINNQSVANSLLLDFGNIPTNSSAIGRWVMQTTLSGKFTEFDATFSHADELGGALTSLIDAVNTHLLIRDVQVDLPGRDSVADFLASQAGVLTVFESDSVDTPVADLSSSAVLTAVTSRQHKLTFNPTAGAGYVQLPDPFNGEKAIVQAVRSDGKVINPANVWLSRTYNKDLKQWQHYFNIFDTQTSGQYTVDFEVPALGPVPPVLQFIPNWTGSEHGQIGFLIEASDPNGDDITFAVNPLPAGAELVDVEPGKARFNWQIETGQIGNFPLTVSASDGALYANQNVMLTVFPAGDSDGDGLNDEWEIEHFGDLSRDGSGDFDNDGVSDKDEFLLGTDPTLENGPRGPEIVSPKANAVATATPELVVNNSVYGGQQALSYFFELYADDQLTQVIARSPAVSQGLAQTSWSAAVSLQENQRYFWRVRAYNGAIYSPWSDSFFMVNQYNEAPLAPAINSPVTGAELASLMPALSIVNASDPDGDELTYVFTLYADEGAGQMLAQSNHIVADASGITQWQVPTALQQGGVYYWQAEAFDSAGLSQASARVWFSVFGNNQAPAKPSLIHPLNDVQVTQDSVEIKVSSVTDPEGENVTYLFELDTVDSFDSVDLVSETLTSAGSEVVWPVTGLKNAQSYFWRVRAQDASGAYSEPLFARFDVNLSTSAPIAPTVKNPGADSWVESLTPTLSVYEITNSSRPIAEYEFEVYADEALTVLLDAGSVTSSAYMVSAPLADNAWYFWRARAVDSAFATSDWSLASRFFVNDQGADEKPIFNWLQPSSDVAVSQGDKVTLSWEDQDPDSAAFINLYYTRSQNAIVIDDASSAFEIVGNWQQQDAGEVSYHFLNSGQTGSFAKWYWTLEMAGRYEVQVFWPQSNLTLANNVSYMMETLQGDTAGFTNVTVSPVAGEWVSLGEHELANGLFELFLNANAAGALLADQVRLLPISVPGKPIVLHLDENADEAADSYEWDTSALAPGQYQVVAVIRDKTHSVKVVSPNSVTIKDLPYAVVDNDDPSASYVGDWNKATGIMGQYGLDYRHIQVNSDTLAQQGGQVSFQWRFSVAQSGWYAINFKHLAGFNNNLLKFELKSNTNMATLKSFNSISQTSWVNLGKLWLNAGEHTVQASLSEVGSVAVDAIEIRSIDYVSSDNLEVDNQDIGFAYAGNWSTSSYSPGFIGVNYAYLCGGDESAKAQWKLQIPESGLYEVSTRWTSNRNRASNAKYSIHHSNLEGAADLTKVVVDQRSNGGRWNSLGIYNFADLEASVVLEAGGANGCLIADAVKLTKIVPEAIELDNDLAGFSTVGSWVSSQSIKGFVGESYVHARTDELFEAKWSTHIAKPTRYRVLARWTSHSNRSSHVEYDIYSNGQLIATQVVSQRVNGGTWQGLGEFDFVAGDLSVVVSTRNSNGYVIADAIKLEQVN